MTIVQAKDALSGCRTTIERIGEKYIREGSGRVIQGKTIFPSQIIQREYNSVVIISELLNVLTPEQFAAIMSGERVTIPPAGKRAKTGEPDWNFTPMFPS